MAGTMRRARVIGEHVYLRPMEREDINDQYLDWVNDIRLNKFILAAGFPVTRDDLLRYFESHGKDALLFAICDKETDTWIGNARLSHIDWLHRVARYGWLLGSAEYRSRGYGSDALIQLLRFGFHNLGMNRIWSGVGTDNIASIRSNEKVGMVNEGVLREFIFAGGAFLDCISFSMLRSDFDALHGDAEDWVQRGGLTE